jgi:hypothetical protein
MIDPLPPTAYPLLLAKYQFDQLTVWFRRESVDQSTLVQADGPSGS